MKKCRKLLLFSGLILLAGALGMFVTNISAEVPNIGNLTDYQRNIGRIWVYNDDYTDRGEGEVLVWKTGSRSTGVEVTTTSAYACEFVAGVVPAGSTITARSWGWLQTTGYHPSVSVTSNTSVGSYLVTAADTEKAAVWVIGQSTFTPVTTPPTGVPNSTSTIQGMAVFGIALDATTSSDTVKALLRIK